MKCGISCIHLRKLKPEEIKPGYPDCAMYCMYYKYAVYGNCYTKVGCFSQMDKLFLSAKE